MLMCDTFVHVPARAGVPVLFGKNSDREPNEAQSIVRYPRQLREKNIVKTSFREVDHPREAFEVILSKPFHLWGAEMGVNEYGVTIGNEAVFTKIPFEKKNTGLTGMDMIRLALEISKSAREALEHIIGYVERYGQDACGGYQDQDFYYHNSFIIADKTEAFVLETAGNFWVYEKVTGYRAISNGLSIEENYDGISKAAKDFARKRNWIRPGEDFNFKKVFSAFWMPKLANGEARRKCSEQNGKQYPALSPQEGFGILRSHGNPMKEFLPSKSKTDSICMHASGLLTPHQTTGSMVAVLHTERPPTVWLTGTSIPCLSLYKPFYFGSDVLDEAHFKAPSAIPDDSYWWQWEKASRQIQRNYMKYIPGIKAGQQHLETQWTEEDRELNRQSASHSAFSDLSKKAFTESRQALAEWLKKTAGEKETRANIFYQFFWNRRNKRVGL